MTTMKQIEANKANALKSTGPKDEMDPIRKEAPVEGVKIDVAIHGPRDRFGMEPALREHGGNICTGCL